MKELINKYKKLSEEKWFKIIRKILSVIVSVIFVLMLLVIVVQRVTGNKFNLFGYGIYTVVSGSMEPEYHVKDLILAGKADPKDINIGDDIVYLGNSESVKGKIVTHRVINKYDDGNGKYRFYTKGIANNLSDPELNESQILGVVKTKLHLFSFCSQIINNTVGFIFVIVIPFILFVFWEGKSIIDEINKKDN